MAKKHPKKSAAAQKKVSTAKSSKAKKAPAKVKKPAAKTAVKKTTKLAAKPVAKKLAKTVKKPVKPAKKVSAKPTKKPAPAPKKVAKAPAKAVKAAVVAKKPVPAKVAPKEVVKAVVKPEPVKAAPKPPVKKPKAPTGPVVTTIRRGIVKAPGEGEDEQDGFSGYNLLAGPRNVTPYMLKSGEEYMGKAQLEHFRNILTTWKRDLMEEVDRTVTHMKDEAANPPDPNDRATLESEFSLELRTRDRERKLIRKIDEALQRIEDGSYGYCLETGEEIGVKRLEARPVATLSIEAQERRERKEKQYGDRDDRYR